MALIIPVKGIHPTIGEDCYIADNATIVGDVRLGSHGSVWFNAVVRGDVNSIHIGQYCNIQDGAVIHCTYEKAATLLGDFVSVGHNALVHGCTIHSYVLVGMGAIVMDHAVVQEYVIIAAGAVVTEGMVCETGYIYAGVPARKLKRITDEQRDMLRKLPHNYVMYAGWFKSK